MKGAPSQQGGYGGFGAGGMPSWLGMAGMYGGGGYGGYGGGYGAGQTGQQGNPYGQLPTSVDFSHGAGLYQPNQAEPYYAGGQPPPPPTPPGQPPGPPQPGQPPGPLQPGQPPIAQPYAQGYAQPTQGLLGGVADTGTMAGGGAYGAPGGLLNSTGPQNWSGINPNWHNRGYGMPGQPGGMVSGSAGGNMTPGQSAPYMRPQGLMNPWAQY